ncbi:tRNA-dihydrouridine(20a/20b) synthase [NAD(P)+]-like protein [Clydaea vesicula]|uniref:tRNA-dihydrouridine synthase n=1 Tax=Clydaea vesicula TaxID=447962 RepID=A0AAD5TWQ9_9FUNG|nr:tRNA-dihydrouridine(20a/20b) synthase [NAD(P)+]-like protein [Clydaea vesicula]KAJ3382349.1 tRNA-dihydrouridine(20a/20b) synthase [NAD(P)+]-like protein [Lobulomyces angularis]
MDNNQTENEWAKRFSPLDLLTNTKSSLNICAPMVRYSKLPFRELVKQYGVDVLYTPMILADVFKNSAISREVDFQTSINDSPVIVQFGAANSKDLADASELVAKYCSGVDINCGCPQKWAISEGIGCHLMERPDLVADMISQTKRRTSILNFQSNSGTGFPCSVKIRKHNDLRRTVDFAQKAEAAGADWITVHGRTRRQRSHEPCDFDAIKLIKESVSIPVFANGDVFNLSDKEEILKKTGCDGVMAARGLLENPALFAGYEKTPVECVKKFVELSLGLGSHHFIFHHHLMYMLEKSMSRAEKKHFNTISSIAGCIDYLTDHYGLEFF